MYLPVAFNVVFTLSMLSIYGQLLEQLNVASLSRPAVFLQYYSLLYFWQINDDDSLPMENYKLFTHQLVTLR